MDALLDGLIGRVASRFTTARLPSPGLALLGGVRAQAAAVVRARHRERALALGDAVDRGACGAAEEYGALAERALAEMRAEVVAAARALGGPPAVLAFLHARFGETEETEHLDDPALDEAMRVRLLAQLDALNTIVGSYRAFFRAMEPLFASHGPTRVIDLAAGHGGFALEAARIAQGRGLAIEITATDLRPEYLALGEAAARREGLAVRFAVQDALDLSALREQGACDVIVCTQSIHHFPPAMTARIFREAARAARRGVVFIDGCRSVSQGLLLPALTGLRYRDRMFAHDAWVSFRRFFTPEELGLVIGLGLDDEIEARWMRPAHCLVRLQR